jgi:hypothetical protein
MKEFRFNMFTLPPAGRRCEKTDLILFLVIPAKAGIQYFQTLSNLLDPGFPKKGTLLKIIKIMIYRFLKLR